MTVYIWTDAEAYRRFMFRKVLLDTVHEIIASDGRILTWLDHKNVLMSCHVNEFNNVGLSGTDAEKVAECDYMLCSWDGCNKARLKSIKSLLALGKKCKMYYLPRNEWVEIFSEAELKALEGDA